MSTITIMITKDNQRLLRSTIVLLSVFLASVLSIQAAPARNAPNASVTNSLTQSGDARKEPAVKVDNKRVKKPIQPSSGRGPLGVSSSENGFGTRLLWYIPNRIMDSLDVFRFRARLGPGLAANVRFTDYGSFYVGKYKSVYVGLPGPREPYYIRSPIGLESLDGIVLWGVDATDNTANGPAYGKTEVDIGAHLLIVGADIGLDPMEFSDLLAGVLMIDLQKDDYPRERRSEPEMTSGISRGSDEFILVNSRKPDDFDSFVQRLDYLHTNLHQYVSGQVRSVDEYFAPDVTQRIAVPDSRLRLGAYVEFVRGHDAELELSPDLDLDVAMPNIERRMHIFVQSGRADELPNASLADSANQNLTVGARRMFKKYDISTDLGVRATWPPRAYARITWHPKYEFEQWSIRPQQRLFGDTKEKLGSLTTLFVDRWLGSSREYYAGNISSVKCRDNFTELKWEQTLRLGRVQERVEDSVSVIGYERRDVASGEDISVSVFGEDEGEEDTADIDTYRMTVGFRRPLYYNWIFWEVEPGIEWTKENDFDSAFRITLGIDMLFWGATSR